MIPLIKSESIRYTSIPPVNARYTMVNNIAEPGNRNTDVQSNFKENRVILSKKALIALDGLSQ